MRRHIEKLKQKYESVKTYIPAVAFSGGFIWDNFTLKRIDNTLDMAIFGAYVVLAGIVIVLIARGVTFKFSEYLPWGVQFFFGGLFSSFFVYYFKSASSLPAFFFMLFLLALLVGNEFLEKRLRNVTLASVLFGVVAFMYLNAVLPVLLRTMNTRVFLLAIVCSFGLFSLLKYMGRNETIRYGPVVAIYLVLIGFYMANIIPPVPLSKKEIGIYRSIERSDDGYRCAFREPPWYAWGRDDESTFAWSEGDTVYCFSSIFAPTRLSTKVYHCWFLQDPKTGKYTQTDRMGYRLVGGRGRGFRGYTFKRHVSPGKWRIAVKTEHNKILGIKNFTVVPAEKQDSVKISVALK